MSGINQRPRIYLSATRARNNKFKTEARTPNSRNYTSFLQFLQIRNSVSSKDARKFQNSIKMQRIILHIVNTRSAQYFRGGTRLRILFSLRILIPVKLSFPRSRCTCAYCVRDDIFFLQKRLHSPKTRDRLTVYNNTHGNN